MPAPSKNFEDHPDFAEAIKAQQRVETLRVMLLEARDVRDAAIVDLLDRDYKVGEIAKTLPVMEGTVRQVREKVKRRDKARRLHAKGKDVPTIADEMGLSIAVVHNLLGGE